MDTKQFKNAYLTADINKLHEFIKCGKIISDSKMIKYMEKSFISNKKVYKDDTLVLLANRYAVYNELLLIVYNRYDLNKIVAKIIEYDNIKLLENILSHQIGIKLDEKLILLTLPKGQLSMAKCIYEYIHRKYNSYNAVCKLLVKYEFVYDIIETDEEEKLIDLFVLAIYNDDYKNAIEISSKINLGFWSNFAIKFCCGYGHNVKIIKKLLRNNAVDPGVNNNSPFKLAIKNISENESESVSARILNELIKHPQVNVDENIIKRMGGLLDEFVAKNYLYSMKKIFHNIDRKIVRSELDLCIMLDMSNDVTYYAYKMGIINESDDSNGVLNDYNLDNYRIDKVFVEKPYCKNLDPEQICKIAIKENDIELAKQIQFYNLAVYGENFFKLLIEYDRCGSEWDPIIKQYSACDYTRGCRDSNVEPSKKMAKKMKKMFK